MWGELTAREREGRRVLLRCIANTGWAPTAGEMTARLGTSPEEAEAILEGLVGKGFVVRDGPTGPIRAAYPLSVVPTGHRVTLATGERVYALCAIDALGVPGALDVDARVEADCPECGRHLQVQLSVDRIVDVDPPDPVVRYSRPQLLTSLPEGEILAETH